MGRIFLTSRQRNQYYRKGCGMYLGPCLALDTRGVQLCACWGTRNAWRDNVSLLCTRVRKWGQDERRLAAQGYGALGEDLLHKRMDLCGPQACAPTVDIHRLITRISSLSSCVRAWVSARARIRPPCASTPSQIFRCVAFIAERSRGPHVISLPRSRGPLVTT